MDRFFAALEANREWLELVTPSEWLAREAPLGRVYVPTSSYTEMGEWALPADEALAFEHALHEAETAGRPEARWLRGGFWRNFQVKYREINELHIPVNTPVRSRTKPQSSASRRSRPPASTASST